MRLRFKRTISFILMLSMILSMMPGLKIDAEAAVSSGINDMTALDALGIDISKAPLGYNPNTAENPFGRETTPIAVVDEFFIVGRSNDSNNYSRLYGDNWAVGGSIDSFFGTEPVTAGDADEGINYVLSGSNAKEVLGANALAMTEANLDMTKSNGGRKDSVAYVSYKYTNPGSEPMSTFCIGLIDPVHDDDGNHTATHKVLISEWNLFGNNEDKSGLNQFKNEYLASAYLKIAAGDFDGDGIDEIAVYVPSVNNPRIEIYKTAYDWKEYGYTLLDRTMIYQLDKYSASKAVAGAVPTAVGDTLVPNMVSLVSADFDMDGIDDLAVSYGYTGSAMDSAPCKAVMLFGEKAGRFGSRMQAIPLSYNGTSIVRASFAAGDIDGDGEKELVVGGSLASANFNPNERYVAVYHWNGSSFSVSQAKKFNIFEKDNGGNYVNTNVPNNKTNFYSLPSAPANIAIGHFNGISEPVDIYIDSILIELGDNGMEITSLMDDKLRTAGNAYAEWGARAAQLSGNGKDTLITMTSDISQPATAAGKNFIQYYNEIIAKLLNPSTEKTYIKAIYGADSGLKVWENEVKGSGFCLPDTDNDSSSIQYTGEHYYTYIDPKILAVLASPPYFKDLFNDETGGDIEPSGTTYGTTKGSGSGSSYSNTLSVGLYTSYEKSVSIFGVELFRYEAELEINNHMTWETLNTSTVEQSVEYQTLSGQDTVVFFSMPVETYVYRQTYPVNDTDGNFLRMETQSMTVNIPHEASVRNLPLEAYERIAADYEELPKISGTVLKHTVGIPSTYPSSTQVYGSTGIDGLPTIVSQGDPAKIGYGASSQTKEIAMSSSTENSFNYELDISTKIGAGGGGLMVGLTAGYAHGAGSVNINTSGSSYSGTLYALPAAAQAYGYDFNWKLFTYPYVNGEQVFPVINYIVSDITQPPLVPDNFVQLDQGTSQEDVALSWQYSGNPKGFTLYRYFRGAGSAGFYEVADISAGDMDYVIDTDGNTRTYRYIDTGLTADTEYLYRIQTVGNSEPSLSIESETLTAYTKPEGIIPDVRISTEELTIYPDTEHTSSVTIANADKLSGSTLYFQWQKYDSEAKKWLDLATLNTTSIRFTDAGLNDEGLYRCKVTSRQNTTIVSSYSPVLNVTYSKRTALMEGLKAVRNLNNGTLSVKLSGMGTKTIPSGTVVFKLEAEGYSKQYAATIDSQGIARVDISTVPGVYKVSADYNGNRVFKSNSIDKDANGNGVFYVYGQGVSGSYYWDYAESYTYGDSIKFTKYIMDSSGTIIDTEDVDFADVINDGKELWRKMELYELPKYDDGGLLNDDGTRMSGKFERGNLYEAKEFSGAKPYCPVVCNELGDCSHGVENIFGDYSNTVIKRFKTGKAGWVGSYYIPYDLDGDEEIRGYKGVYNEESFVYKAAGNPEGFYFTVDKAPLSVDFKNEYRDLVRSISEMEIYEDKKVILTADNYAAYGISEEYWAKINGEGWRGDSGRHGELVFDGELVPCEYSIDIVYYNDVNGQLLLTYHPLTPNGPGAQLAKNKNALTSRGQLFNDDPLETVAADKIRDTGLFDKGYKVYSRWDADTYKDECLFTYPVNLWAFEGHYFETKGSDGNGDVFSYVAGQNDAEERPMDNYYTEHGLNVFRYDRFGARFPITKYMGEFPQTAGQFILGVEPTYYLNSYKSSDNYRLAYVRAHIAENYDITFGRVSMTVTGAAYNVSAETDDITGGSVQLVTPVTGTSRKYPVGTQLIFVARPNEGFEVDYWEVNGVRNQEGGTQLKVTQVYGGVSIKVYFKTKVNTLSYMTEPEKAYVDGQLAENKITCTIPSGKELMAGAEINMSAAAAQGYHFVKWEIHTEGLPTQYKEGVNLKTAMPNANIRIYGVFERDSYTLKIGENLLALSENKAIDTSKPIAGDTVITVKPAAGYQLTGEWQVTEGIQDLDDEEGTFTFKLLKNTEISADINSGTYEVIISDKTTGGAIRVSGASNLQEVKGGTELKFTAVPERGYKVEKWIINGEDSANGLNTYNLVVDRDVDLSASFIEKNHRDLLVSVDGDSYAQLMYTIDNIDYTETYADGKIKLYEGETLIVTAIPGTNSMVAGWSTDGSYSQSYANSYTAAYADDIKNLKVFTQSMYNNKIEFETIYEGSETHSLTPTLTVTSDGGNIANGSLVGAGKKLTFTFSGEGVKVSHWTLTYKGDDEKDILDENHRPVRDNVLEIPYTLNDAKIKAYYKLDSEFEESYMVTVINGSGGGSFAENTVVNISANEAPEGKEFDKWISDDVDFDDDSLPAIRFTMPSRNVKVEASYRDIKAKITNVTISPKSTSAAKGSTTTFSAIVAGTGSYDTSVIWSLEGNEDDDTVINNGILTVGAEETAAILTVTVTSAKDSNVSDSSLVTISEDPVKTYSAKINKGSGSGTYPEHSLVCISASPASKGEEFDRWVSEDVFFEDAEASTTSFVMPNKDVEVTALYRKAQEIIDNTGGGNTGGGSRTPAPLAVTHTIKATAGYGGSITPTSANLETGGSQTFTIIPNQGFAISDVLVNGISIGVLSSYTFTNVDKDAAIEAVFAQKIVSSRFIDVNDRDWFAKSVDYVVNLGLFKGTAENTFSPYASMTRGMFVTVLGRLHEYMNKGSLAQPQELSFTDVPLDMYYAASVKWASDNNIISGYEGGLFKPEDPISREQIVAILYRFALYAGLDTANTSDITIFTDSADISSWALDALKWATGSGLMTGRTDGTLDPQGLVQRCEVAAILDRFILK